MKKNKGNLRKILGLYKDHKALLSFVLFGSVLNSLTALAWPLLTHYVLDNALTETWQNAFPIMMKCLYALIGVLLLQSWAQWIMNYSGSVLTDKIKFGLQKQIFWKYQTMSFSYFDNSRSGSMITLLDYDVQKLDEFVYHLMTTVCVIVMNVIGAIVLFANISIKIVIMILPVLILLIIFNKINSKTVYDAFYKMRNMDKKRMENAEDKIAGVRTVISFGREEAESFHFNNICDEMQVASAKTWVTTSIRNIGNAFFNNVYYLIIVFVGGSMVIKGTMNMADLTVFLMYSYLLSNPINDMSHMSKMYSKAMASFEHIMACLETEPEIKNPRNPVKDDIIGNIEFNDVSFKYPSTNETIISNLSLNIEAGKYIAIVGPSGSGKSTIAGLIPRYYDVNHGTIKIDGVNIKDFDLQHLRRSIGVVQQDIYLFFGTIYDNIVYGNTGATMDEVIQAAKLANAHEFISNLPNGYNSNIGDRGVKLSGGQKQRIAIARIFLENPSIIIFDEATSALDNESEKEVQRAMENLSKKRTTIVIAHRLSTIKNADEILFLTKNGIEERGTHLELLKMHCKYAKLYNSSNE